MNSIADLMIVVAVWTVAAAAIVLTLAVVGPSMWRAAREWL